MNDAFSNDFWCQKKVILNSISRVKFNIAFNLIFQYSTYLNFMITQTWWNSLTLDNGKFSISFIIILCYILAAVMLINTLLQNHLITWNNLFRKCEILQKYLWRIVQCSSSPGRFHLSVQTLIPRTVRNLMSRRTKPIHT